MLSSSLLGRRGVILVISALLAWRTFWELAPEALLGGNPKTAAAPAATPAGSSLWRAPPYLPPEDTPSNLLTAEFCLSCHMNGRFRAIADHARRHVRVPLDAVVREQLAQGMPYSAIPDFSLESETEPLQVRAVAPRQAPLVRLLSTAFSLVRWAVFLGCAVGPVKAYAKVANLAGFAGEVPRWVQAAQNGRWQVMGLSILGFNLLNGYLTNSRGFEIFLGTTPVYSALESGKLPEIDDVLLGLKAAGAILVD